MQEGETRNQNVLWSHETPRDAVNRFYVEEIFVQLRTRGKSVVGALWGAYGLDFIARLVNELLPVSLPGGKPNENAGTQPPTHPCLRRKYSQSRRGLPVTMAIPLGKRRASSSSTPTR